MAMAIRDASSDSSRSKCACGMPANKIIAHETRYTPMCRTCFAQLRNLMNQSA